MIHIGTCSWTEKSLIQSGEFYPKGIATPESRLRYYADSFDTVEVDSSYYAIPDARTTQAWVERTPADFIFHVKAYGALTGHGIDPKSLPVDIVASLPKDEGGKQYVYITEPELLKAVAERFKDALKPLIEARKLGVLVFQFPPWLLYKKSNLDYLLKCQELMEGLPVAVEFRHGSWLTPEKRDSVIHFLREYRLIYVTADEPQYESLATIPFVPDVTGCECLFQTSTGVISRTG